MAYARWQTCEHETGVFATEPLANAIYHRYAAQTVCSMNEAHSLLKPAGYHGLAERTLRCDGCSSWSSLCLSAFLHLGASSLRAKKRNPPSGMVWVPLKRLRTRHRLKSSWSAFP